MRYSCIMDYSFPIVVENAVQIAWDVLERSGEIHDPNQTSWFLLKHIEHLARSGERRRLMLVNRTIDAYRARPEKLVA